METAEILTIELALHETAIELFKLSAQERGRDLLAVLRLLLRVVQRTRDGCFVVVIIVVVVLLGSFHRAYIFDGCESLRSLFSNFFEADVGLQVLTFRTILLYLSVFHLLFFHELVHTVLMEGMATADKNFDRRVLHFIVHSGEQVMFTQITNIFVVDGHEISHIVSVTLELVAF